MGDITETAAAEGDILSAGQEMPPSLRHCIWTTRVHWTANVHCRIQNSPPLFCFLRHCHSGHAPPNYFFKIHFNIIPTPLTPRFSKQSPSCSFPHRNLLCVYCLSTPATCPACPTLLHLTLPVLMSDVQSKLRSSSLRGFLQSPVFFRSLRPKYFPQHPILGHPRPEFYQVPHPNKIHASRTD